MADEAVRHNKPWTSLCIVIPFTLSVITVKGTMAQRHQPRPADYTFANMPNPVGGYRREFTLPTSLEGRDVFIRFNGSGSFRFLSLVER